MRYMLPSTQVEGSQNNPSEARGVWLPITEARGGIHRVCTVQAMVCCIYARIAGVDSQYACIALQVLYVTGSGKTDHSGEIEILVSA